MSNRSDLAFTPALEQAALVRTGEISPVELVDLYLERIEEFNPKLNAYLTVAGEQALAAARRAEDALDGDDLPPFHGVPMSVKDNVDTAGIRTTHATAAWVDRVPDTDDEVVARFRKAGFVILGKTTMPEFATLNVSEPPAYPPGRNPWDPDRSCGGSSGGAAAALAAGLCSISHGNDAGGSIRIPSAWCGVFGLKPSRGRVSWAPWADRFLWVNGPIARTVADAAAMLDSIAGPAPGDIFWAPPPMRPFLKEAGEPPGTLRIAFHPHPGREATSVAPAHRAAVDDTARLLEELGHVVEEAEPPVVELELLGALVPLIATEVAGYPIGLPTAESFDPFNVMLIEMGRSITAVDYEAARRQLESIVRRLVAFFDDYDLLLTPTVAGPPPPIGLLQGDVDDFAAVMLRLLALTPFTGNWNPTGQPAASLPLAMDDEGLPVAVQLIGRPNDEATVIRVSAQLEEARPWADRRPPIS